jgi:PRTRC genetic system ThiF family protein
MNYHYLNDYLADPSHEIKVTLIGVGGTGSKVLTGLARMNEALKQLGRVGLSVTVWDDDVIQEHNCGRQLFSKQDIGAYKAEVLVTRLNRFFGTEWISMPCKFNNSHCMGNIVISCVDNVNARKIIKKEWDKEKNSARRAADYADNYYWLDFGNGDKFGQVILGSKLGKLPDILDIYPDLEDDNIDAPSCSMQQSLNRQSLFINSTLAELGLAMLWELFSEFRISYHGIYLNLRDMKTKPLHIKNSL